MEILQHTLNPFENHFSLYVLRRRFVKCLEFYEIEFSEGQPYDNNRS